MPIPSIFWSPRLIIGRVTAEVEYNNNYNFNNENNLILQ